MKYNFNKTQGRNEVIVCIEGQEISKGGQFRYLGSIINAEDILLLVLLIESKQDELSGGMLPVSCVIDAYI